MPPPPPPSSIPSGGRKRKLDKEDIYNRAVVGVTIVETAVALVEGRNRDGADTGGRHVEPGVYAGFLPQKQFDVSQVVQAVSVAPTPENVCTTLWRYPLRVSF